MTLKELNKLIEDEVSNVVTTTNENNMSTNNGYQVVSEPELQQEKRPRYKNVLKNEDEIDEMLFWAGKKPKYIKKYRR